MVGTGSGLTVMVNVILGPVHPFADGVTVIVPTIGTAPGLVATNDGMFPVPLAPSPIAGLLLVHVKVVPATGPLSVIGAVVLPAQ
jgi:hypothetical protein